MRMIAEGRSYRWIARDLGISKNTVGEIAKAAAKHPAEPRRREPARDAGMIELEIHGIAMRVGRGADSKTVAAVIRALKAMS